jgi:sugar phosphate isomerase/epimerase
MMLGMREVLSRRRFLGTVAALGPATLNANADPLGMPVGCQVYPVREVLGKDFEGTLRELHTIGYRSIEMCSPKGYARSGFGPLADLKAADVRHTIHSVGLRCESSHFNMRELRESLSERIDWAKEMGLKQMVCSTLSLKPDASMSDWSHGADELNKIGEQVYKAGMELGFHNHNFEFKEIDGVLVYDKLMSVLDPKVVKMQFQVAVVGIGHDPVKYLTKYPGRFLSLHLQDWSPSDKKLVAVGKGVVDWPKVFSAAKTAGVKNYFVEMNLDAMKESYTYLHGLKV